MSRRCSCLSDSRCQNVGPSSASSVTWGVSPLTTTITISVVSPRRSMRAEGLPRSLARGKAKPSWQSAVRWIATVRH